jgi:hypothetical protein
LRISVLLAFAVSGATARAETPPEMPALFPGGAIAFAELSGLGDQLERVRNSELFAAWLASPQYQRYEASPDYRRLAAAREIAERQLEMDVWTAAKLLLAGNVAVAIYPKDGNPRPDLVAIVRTVTPDALSELRRQLDPILVLASDQIRRTESLAGVETYSLPQDAAFVAWRGDWLVVATSRPLLDKVLSAVNAASKPDEAERLVADSSYAAMDRAVDWELPRADHGQQRILRLYVDTALLNKATGGRPIPEKLDNPVGSLLFGDVVELLRTSPFAAGTVDVGDSGLSVKLNLARDAQKVDEAHRSFLPEDGSGLEPLPPVPDLIGGFALYRDFAHWYSHREDLLQEQVLPGFDKFETGLANLLPGQDFGEDVLPLFGKRISFVAAPQNYSHLDGEPGVKLPGMAVVVELKRPDEAATLLQLFFQTLAAILNLEAGQQGRQPWVVTSETYRDVQVTYAKYLQKPLGKELGIVFNFLPAAARVGNRFILSSSFPLCKQLIDTLNEAAGNEGAAAPPKTVAAELYFAPITAMLERNASFFVGRMTQEGRTTEEAKSEFAAILDILRRFNSVQAATEVSPHVFQLRIEGTWK